jgi:NAD(P)-dependent dehydrogenase (short-subunit alcohol dehydrogenase family)
VLWKKAVDLANSVNGDADILVNNAANDDRHETLNVTEEYWDNSQAINLKSYFFACQYVLPGMQAKGGGSIINFSSISYMMGNSGYPAYTTANAGIMGMTRSLAREFGPNNIRVNAIAPGWVLTKKQLDKWATQEGLKTHLDRQCIKSHLKEEDIAGGALFLASASSSMITGQLIAIDGGVVMTG